MAVNKDKKGSIVSFFIHKLLKLCEQGVETPIQVNILPIRIYYILVCKR